MDIFFEISPKHLNVILQIYQFCRSFNKLSVFKVPRAWFIPTSTAKALNHDYLIITFRYWMDGSSCLAVLWNGSLIFNKIIKVTNSVTNFRNRTMLFCNLFMYYLPPSVVLSVHEDPFWNLCWREKKCPFTHFNTVLRSRHAFVKNGILRVQCSKLQSLSHRILILFLKTRNTSHTGETGFCYEGEGLCMCCISQKSNWAKHHKAFIFPEKMLSRNIKFVSF